MCGAESNRLACAVSDLQSGTLPFCHHTVDYGEEVTYTTDHRVVIPAQGCAQTD